MSLRDIKAQARGDLHLAMRVPANLVFGGTLIAANTHVRVHSKFEAKGDMQGTSFNYAERLEQTPRLVFWRAEIDAPTLRRGVVVVISAEEGYRLDTAEPPDLQTVTFLVTPMKPEELVGLPIPDGA